MSYAEFARLTATPLDRAVDRAIARVNAPDYDPGQDEFLQALLADDYEERLTALEEEQS